MIKLKGSKRCILDLIESSNYISTMNSLLGGSGFVISKYDSWKPLGRENDEEAELKDFLSAHFGKNLADEIKSWWLALPSSRSRTPNWDLVSTCTFNGKKALLLVEAKAHVAELTNESKGKPLSRNASANSIKNHAHITKAIETAKNEIWKSGSEINISIGNCYQLSNRIAHAWWLASNGIPVVLLYLGFLKVEDMRDGKNKIFEKESDWNDCFLTL